MTDSLIEEIQYTQVTWTRYKGRMLFDSDVPGRCLYCRKQFYPDETLIGVHKGQKAPVVFHKECYEKVN